MRLIALLCLVACGGEEDTDPGEAHPFAGHPIIEARGRVLNVAHRGGADLAPEETTVAFDNALAQGADMLEVDVWSTSDGVLVLQHDEDVERTTDGEGDITELTWAEVQQLDAGYDFTPDEGLSFPFRGTGVKVARLDDVLAAYGHVPISIEIKQTDPPIVDAVIEVIDAAGMRDNVVIGAFSDSVIAEVRAAAPDVLTAYGLEEGLRLFFLDEEDEPGYRPPTYYFAAPIDFGDMDIDLPTVERAHRFGVVVHVWTVNARADMERVAAMGADGILTDDPVTLAAVITAL